ncbi:hypothetical protein ES319_A10G216500v1 [Gossypium barbadense]|uniref:NAC domain-containing protein n=2 Tax=Gossypium TaxID=3633 RepID=A0A5J5U809_GOSBA|nr:hypothetical protein ES319_A10G216500v1 [Gossypium barbadense]TYH00051.1 hypothetical protein ES288_A10G243800v1 [Gossypium darwinii]
MGGETSLTLVSGPTSPPPSAAAAKTGGSATALAPGFRFHPTDEELVSYYLKRKVSNKPVRFNAMAEVDIYKHEPWDLSDKAKLQTRDQEWYFFSLLDKKYGNGGRMNRATNQGYWKATGKDREVRHNTQLIGMKKTLVFHSGRAPDGMRTNWVMHEYRLAEEELEKIGALQETEHAGKDALPNDEVPREMLNDKTDDCPPLPPCKVERPDDCPPICMLNREASLPLLRYKRRRHTDLGPNHANASENSTRTTQDRCSSTTTTAAAATTTSPSSATTTAISALLEFSLMESLELKENNHRVPPPTFDIANLDSVVPPSCMKLINELQKEIRKISVERESLKLEMMSAQTMINILHSRIDSLSKENQELKRSN